MVCKLNKLIKQKMAACNIISINVAGDYRDQQKGRLFNIFTSITASKKKIQKTLPSICDTTKLKSHCQYRKGTEDQPGRIQWAQKLQQHKLGDIQQNKWKFYAQSRSNSKHFCCRLGVCQLETTELQKNTRAQAEQSCQWDRKMEKTSAIMGFINHGAFSGGREMHKLLHVVLAKHPAQHHIHFWSDWKDKLKIDVQRSY